MQSTEEMADLKILSRLFGLGVFILVIAVVAMTFMLHEITAQQSPASIDIWQQFETMLNGG